MPLVLERNATGGDEPNRTGCNVQFVLLIIKKEPECKWRAGEVNDVVQVERSRTH